MADSFEEHHIYRQPISSAAGQRERVEFLFARLWVELGGDDAKVRALFRKAGHGLDTASYRQYRQAALLEQLDAMKERIPHQLARNITARSRGDNAMVDRIRHQIERADTARTEGIATGTWDPPQVTSGSSVDKTRQNR